MRPPGDKSLSHRALIVAALASGVSLISGCSTGDDVAATRRALEQLGARVSGEPPGTMEISGPPSGLVEPEQPLDLGNAGTGLRLLAGVLAGQDLFAILTGDGSLRSRPMARIVEPLRAMGALIDGRDDGGLAPLAVRGGALRGATFAPPEASAQVKGAILFAGLTASGATTVIERRGTRQHTEELLRLAGASVTSTLDSQRRTAIRIEPCRLSHIAYEVPADPSQAAFFAVGATIMQGSEVEIEGIYDGPHRCGYLDVLDRMGAAIERRRAGDGRADLLVRSASLVPTEVVADEIPGCIDEIPILSVAAAAASGVTVFRGAGELRRKESDRMGAIATCLARLGVTVEIDGDDLAVHGRGSIEAAQAGELRVDAADDHRMAMALAIFGAARPEGSTLRIGGASAISTSYPGFSDDLEALRCR